ncbi:MAG: hypothetical protein AAF762_12235, partial [Pseudomonadota bacterium]
VIEIGAEYYSRDVWEANAGDPAMPDLFAAVFAEMVAAFATAEAAHSADVYEIAVQAARFQSDDGNPDNGALADADSFIDAYLARGVASDIDALVWHRYVYTFDQTAHHLDPARGEHTLTQHVDMWETALGRPLDLVTGWAAPDVDRNAESLSDPNFDFGPRSAHATLQIFSELSEAGADVSTIYGIDSPWIGAPSTGGNSANDFAVRFNGEVYRLMTESLVGLTSTDAFHHNHVVTTAQNEPVPTNLVNVFGFTGADRHVDFLAAWDLLDTVLDVEIMAPAAFDATHAILTMLVPDSMAEDAGAIEVAPSAERLPNGNILVHDVTDFAVIRAEFVADDQDLNVSHAWQTVVNLDTGRGLTVLSDADDDAAGSSVADVVLGGAGDDFLSGQSGADLLIGDGVSPDVLRQWLSSDTFEFAADDLIA